MDIELAIKRAGEQMVVWGQARAALEESRMEQVLTAFRNHKISAHHLGSATGYGYGDVGRDTLEEVWAEIFGAEAALVRQQIANGTQAIYLALAGNLKPGEELLYLGHPYDTLEQVIGAKVATPCSLAEGGVLYREIEIDYEAPDLDAILQAIGPETKNCCFYSVPVVTNGDRLLPLT